MPFADESFDIVVSTFGCTFAPRHEVAAAELARVLRPGGRLAVCSWTPAGAVGDFFRTVGGHLPPPPDFASPAPLWGSEEHVRALFDGTGVELSFEHDAVVFRFGSVDEAVDYYAANFGPIIKAREHLEPEGRWEALLTYIVAAFERGNTARDGTLVTPAEYLVALGRKR